MNLKPDDIEKLLTGFHRMMKQPRVYGVACHPAYKAKFAQQSGSHYLLHEWIPEIIDIRMRRDKAEVYYSQEAWEARVKEQLKFETELD